MTPAPRSRRLHAPAMRTAALPLALAGAPPPSPGAHGVIAAVEAATGHDHPRSHDWDEEPSAAPDGHGHDHGPGGHGHEPGDLAAPPPVGPPTASPTRRRSAGGRMMGRAPPTLRRPPRTRRR